MEKLYQFSANRINTISTGFKRYLWNKIDWNNRLIALTGARGVGKTTLLLQYIREHLNYSSGEVIYVSMDDLYFSKNSLVDFAGEFVKRGGSYLFIDEIHKYRNWSQEIKSIYDYFSDLRIVVTGSSALDIYRGSADLSRRAVVYKMKGLSLREFIEFKYGISFPVHDLENVLHQPSELIAEILKATRPVKMFEEYVRYGYYPFFSENEESYHDRLKQTVNHVLEVDLPSVENIDYTAVHHLRVLLSVISEIVPFKPNILKLSHQVGVSRETLLKYLHLLAKADILMLLESGTHGIGKLNKPEKVYLNNPNLMFSLSHHLINTGTVRETFLFNQLIGSYQVNYSKQGDFVVDNRYTIEVGGGNKSGNQVSGLEQAYIAADNIEYSVQNKIPLWLFGFLY